MDIARVAHVEQRHTHFFEVPRNIGSAEENINQDIKRELKRLISFFLFLFLIVHIMFCQFQLTSSLLYDRESVYKHTRTDNDNDGSAMTTHATPEQH